MGNENQISQEMTAAVVRQTRRTIRDREVSEAAVRMAQRPQTKVVPFMIISSVNRRLRPMPWRSAKCRQSFSMNDINQAAEDS